MLKWILPLAILIFFEAIADIFSKNWSLRGGWFLAVGGLLAYFLANTFWLFALHNGSGLGRGAIIFSVASAIIALFLGFFVYGEKFGLLQMVGVILGFVSIIFILWD